MAEENEDYLVFDRYVETPNGGRPQQEYILTTDLAKEILLSSGARDVKVEDNLLSFTLVSKSKTKSNLLYLISNGEYTKIGVTTQSVNRRLKTMQTGNAKKLVCIYALLVKDAKQLESELHEFCKDEHVSGEWFDLTYDDINYVKAFIMDWVEQN